MVLSHNYKIISVNSAVQPVPKTSSKKLFTPPSQKYLNDEQGFYASSIATS